MINDLTLIVKEFGEPVIKSGELSSDEFSKFLKLSTVADKVVFKMIIDELRSLELTPFNLYCALIEAVNNFRFKVEHLRVFTKYEVSVKRDKLIIKDSKGSVSFKLINKVTPKALWKSYKSFKGDKFSKVLSYGSPSGFMLGRPFLFSLRERDVKVSGVVNGVLKGLRVLLSDYFTNFVKMNTYRVTLSPVSNSLLKLILIKLSDGGDLNAHLVLNQLIKSSGELLLIDELRDWLLSYLVKLGRKAGRNEVLTGLINEVMVAVLSD